MPPVRNNPMVGVVAQVTLLLVLAATVGLGPLGAVAGLGYGLAVFALLNRAMRRVDAGALGPADWVTLTRATLEPINELFMRVTLNFGYMEQPNIPKAMAICRKQGWKFDIMTTSFFLSRRSLKPAANSGMPLWQDRLYIGLARTASDATEYFQIPTGRVVEIGTQVAI